MKVLALLCPGQGAQKPGMLTEWLGMPGAVEALEAFGDASGVDIATHGSTSDAETIKDTQITQPLLVASALLSARGLATSLPEQVVVAGHSVGELAALALAGVIEDADAMRLVGVRGRAMAEAAAVETTSMAAVLGGVEEDVLSRLDELGLTPANMNGGGQIVAAGSAAGIAALAAEPPARARVIELQVAGAFHTDYMAPAVDALRDAAASVAPLDPGPALLSNADGTAVRSGQDALDRVVAQVSRPVRWDLCQQTMVDMGVTAIVELAPGGVLTGLAKRSMKGIPAVAVTTPADLDAARDLIKEHA